MKHWMQRELAAAYLRWVENCAEARRQRQLLSKALRRLAHGQLSRAFLRWAKHVAKAKKFAEDVRRAKAAEEEKAQAEAVERKRAQVLTSVEMLGCGCLLPLSSAYSTVDGSC